MKFPLAVCVIIGSALATAACQPTTAAAAKSASSPSGAAVSSGSPAATGSPAAPASTGASGYAGAPAGTPSSSSGGSAGAASAPSAPPAEAGKPAAGTSDPQVVANCSGDTASVKPTQITVACGDGGAWVQGMTWTGWGSATATGTGQFYQNTCQPDCAEGKPASYPVQVTLSKVENDPVGAYFSDLTVTWEGAAPPGSAPTTSYRLTTPSHP